MMEGVKRSIRVALFSILALLAAACGSSTTDASAVENSIDQAEPTAQDAVDEVAAAADPADLATNPVTATTVHETTSEEFPDIIAVQATPTGDGTWRFDVTVSSTYDTPERYADAWRVVGPDGTEYGVRVLTHDHASEQPFTRSQSGIEIPADVQTVTIEGRDLVNGWGGGTLELSLS